MAALPTSARVVLYSIGGGILGWIGGVAVPIMLDPTTVQGPLLGVLLTGPLGFVVGGVLALLQSVLRQSRVEGTELVFLAVFGGLDALLCVFMIALGGGAFAFTSVFGMLLTAITAAVSFWSAGPGDPLRHAALGGSMAALLFFVTVLFPPVTPNPYLAYLAGTALSPGATQTRFLFLLSPGLNSPNKVAEFVVNLPQLCLEWLITAAVIAVMVHFFDAGRRRASSR